MTWTVQPTDLRRRVRKVLYHVRKQRASWLVELQEIAEEVSARAVLSEDEAAALMTQAIRETRKR